MNRRKIHIIGGGTISHVTSHFALCAPAYGTVAREIAALCSSAFDMDVELHLTKMADPSSSLETWDDMSELVSRIIADKETKIVFFSPAIVDFHGEIDGHGTGKYATRPRSQTDRGEAQNHNMTLTPYEKLITRFRQERKDILLVGFKSTSGLAPQEQYVRALNMLKASSANIVLANDATSRNNMLVVPEEASYHETTDRAEVLKQLIDMVHHRSHLTFTRSTVVDGSPIPWRSDIVPASLRKIVDHCIMRGAYKRFRGVTAGHFAASLSEDEFLTSQRKTDFNDLEKLGLLRVKTDGPDTVIAYGGKPSVGGQSQRLIFRDHPDKDCVVHFHCPLKEGVQDVPIVSQREFECGSHECGFNTSQGLKDFGDFSAVYLDRHGPNIVFNRTVDPASIISFIDEKFDLTLKTGGYQLA